MDACLLLSASLASASLSAVETVSDFVLLPFEEPVLPFEAISLPNVVR